MRITVTDGSVYPVRRCALSMVANWLHIEFIRMPVSAVETLVHQPELLETITFDSGELRQIFTGYTCVQRIEETDIGVEAVLMTQEEKDAEIES